MDGDVDARAVAGERLVDGVVDDLVDEVVQPPQARRADVHPGALADGLETLEDGDVLGVVGAGCAPAVRGVGFLRQRASVDVKNPRLRASRHPAGARATGSQNNSTSGAFPPPPTAPKVAANSQQNWPRGHGHPLARRAASSAASAPREAPERGVQARHQIRPHQVELLGPDGGRAGHREHPVALRGRRRLRGDDVADDVRPHALHAGQRRRRREPVGSAAIAADGGPRFASPHAATARDRDSTIPPSPTRSAATPGASAPGTWAELGRREHAPAAARRRVPPAARGGRASSSLMTSSRSSSGARAALRRRGPRARRAAARAGRGAARPATRRRAAHGRRAAGRRRRGGARGW